MNTETLSLDIYTATISGSETEKNLQQINLEIARRFQQAKNNAGNIDHFEEELDKTAMDIAAELGLYYQPIHRAEKPPVMVFSQSLLPPQTLNSFAQKLGV